MKGVRTMALFSLVIPNYNSEKWIVRLLDSVRNQTFKDYNVIIIDDMSTDNSPEIIKEYISEHDLFLDWFFDVSTKKLYNGGSRNWGVEIADGEYILFADCDDYFYKNTAFEEIAKAIENNNHPDMVRLPYRFEDIGVGDIYTPIQEKTLEAITHSVFVAPWTKCIKRSLFVPFPENTLIEDIVQHIAQMDIIETVAYCPIPIIVWNRRNTGAISANKRTYTKDDKRYSSIWRNVADLYDLKPKHDYCIAEKEKRLNFYLERIRKGTEFSIINH